MRHLLVKLEFALLLILTLAALAWPLIGWLRGLLS